ncbi:MAG TPA: 2'-5' RNA ligase family protein [Sphingomonas sp.]|nr:2'-5' RNA ligase family protein [Sphingomonas sp.]
MIAAPIIVTATFGDADLAWLDAQRREHFPPERNHLHAHLTMFHHLPPSVEREIRDALKNEVRVASPHARLTGLINLGRGVAYRVESAGLSDIRARMSERFATLLTPQDSASWRPHITVQNKVAPEQARALLTDLTANFVPRPLVIAGLAAHWYRGGPWDLLASYRFRG